MTSLMNLIKGAALTLLAIWAAWGILTAALTTVLLPALLLADVSVWALVRACSEMAAGAVIVLGGAAAAVALIHWLLVPRSGTRRT